MMARPSILALPLLLAAAPAAALTPEELWSAWQAQAQGFGVTLGAEAVPGADGSLTLRSWTRQLEGGPVEPLPADVPVQELVLRPTADGAVQVELVGLPPTATIPAGANGMGDLYVAQEGLRITARDGVDAIDYEVAAESIQFATLPPQGGSDPGQYAGEIWDFAVSFPGDLGADRTVTVGLSMGGYAYVADEIDPASGQPSSHTGRVQIPVSLTSTVVLPEGVDWAAMEDTADVVGLLDLGFAVDLSFEAEAGTQTASLDSVPFAYMTRATNGPGSATFRFDRSGLSLVGGFEGGSGSLASPDLPAQSVDFGYGPLRVELVVPLGPDVAEMRYLLSVENVSLSEPAWASIDPQGLLPREPVTFLLDLGGRMTFDLAAQAAAQEAALPSPPPAIETVELRALDLAALGARVVASGSLTFEPSAPEPTGGEGTVRIEGLNRILDAAVNLGWATPEDLLPVRAAVAGFFRETAPDVRETAIEVREGGAIFANGLQIQ